jgi:hypothetical protein
MSIYTVSTTVSHRYYAKMRKSDIRYRIQMLADTLVFRGISLAPVSDYLEEAADNPNMTASDLADVAMKLHDLFPVEGVEESQPCNRDGCPGTMEWPYPENCSCHINPPCASCTNRLLTCSECYFEVE